MTLRVRVFRLLELALRWVRVCIERAEDAVSLCESCGRNRLTGRGCWDDKS